MRAIFESVNAPCAICGQATIDWAAERHDPDAFELDHIQPVSTHPQMQFDAANVQPTHSRCNRHRGPGRIVATIGQTSEAW
jgi:hypothetical protein